MAKSAKSIESGVLEELNRLGAARGPIAGWLEGLEASRDGVSEPVYRRVLADYSKRIADLDRLAGPLRVEATRTIALLDEQLAQLETEKQEVELDLQEMELRHRLEEYSDTEFESRAKLPRERIDGFGLESAKIRATRELWLAARGKEIAESAAPKTPDPPKSTPPAAATAHVSIAPPPTPPTPPMAPLTPMPPTIVGVVPSRVEITLPHPIPPPRPSPPAIPPPQNAEEAARTRHLSGPIPPAPPVVAPVAGTPPSSPADTPALDRTVIYAPEPPSLGFVGDPGASTLRLKATLVPVDSGDGSAQEHSLTAENTIGRVRENSIQIQQGSVSRHHAILRFTAEGWTLEDLKAENGTWVNGDRIEKRRLADGDRVNIGTVRFVFRIG